MQKVVGLVGLRGSGKDTAAQFLVAKGWRRIAFADALYLEVAEAFGVTVEFLQRRETKETPQPELALINCKDEVFVGCFLAYDEARQKAEGAPQPSILTQLSQPRSPREILQVWGTEYRRQMYTDDYWRAQVAKVVKAHPETNFVITDVRFPDEGHLVEDELDGELGRIRRPGLGGSNDKALLHASEVAMLDYPIALEFLNEEGDAGLANFRAAVLRAFH
ncbi:hypothetical protein [Burkholderia ubonensis]|uniref:hypothetical protein n=1 Tax=Burkholderia ubonensis TaxID=101571 RepID=UPI000755CE9F|nr:hypothetical protein [Burkholderia ubonensis]KVP75335.1 hypothetical protein WJ93_07930 [Burkholderia ubonensis]KVZ92844.1 hypothetical protein WL25_17790 [Burkholderia ubonensis]